MMTTEEAVQYIAKQKWTFAKTYASFSPHEYIVRDKVASVREYEAFREFLKQNAEPRLLWSKIWMCWYAPDGWRYWDCDTVVNRGSPDTDKTKPCPPSMLDRLPKATA